MKINIENYRMDNLIWLTVSCYGLNEIELRKKLYTKIILELFNSSYINLITIEPQEYSLTYGIIPNYLRRVVGKRFLVNNISESDSRIIQEIVSSEEFRRTLLFISKGQFPPSDNDLKEVLDLPNGNFDTKLNEVIYCEDDGGSLCLYKTKGDTERLKLISQEFTEDITVKTLQY